ncbi:MAG: ABC transporter permease, partial [Candidatus Dadabacteria bacterium]|nr:ABC transporter permease [Candidatus Dadabacteria bacterium]
MSEPKSLGFWGSVWEKFKRDRFALGALVVIVVLFGIAVFQDFLAGSRPIVLKYDGEYYFPVLFQYPEFFQANFKDLAKELPEGDFAVFPPVRYSPTENDLLSILNPPSSEHYFGTDDRGRDVLSRMIHGARISLSIGFIAVGISVIIGVILGGIAGYYGGKTDFIVSRLFEVGPMS